MAENEGIVPIVAKPDRCLAPDPKYSSSNFIYDELLDCYRCPEGKILPRKTKRKNSNAVPEYGNRKVFADCLHRDKCTNNKDGKYIRRDEFQSPADRAFLKVYENRTLYKKRKTLPEHIFGTVKADFGSRYLFVRRTGMVKTDTCLFFLTYSLKRAVNILGAKRLAVV